MSELALKLIAENKKTKAKSLDLGNCGLTEVPEEVGNCVWLEELILSKEWLEYNFYTMEWDARESQNTGPTNSIYRLSPRLLNLLFLRKLVIADQNISDLTALSSLANLQHLDCGFNQISDLSPIRNLINLRYLNCDTNNIFDLSPIFMLKNLVSLYCRNNKITTLYPVRNLINLENLYCRGNEISDIDPIVKLTNLLRFTFPYNKVENLKPIANLIHLRKFSCSCNKIKDLAPIANLITLNEINCYSNKISDLVPLTNLLNLQQLKCYENEIIDLNPLINLTNLKQLYAYSNNITDLRPILSLIKKGVLLSWSNNNGDIRVQDNPLLHPPPEIVQQGNAAILQYFAAREKQGTGILTEAKIVIVGAGESGKTTLIKKLINPNHPVPGGKKENRTHGIEITPYLIRPDEPDALTAHLWDFGGQELYHATHQFFLTPDTLYLLLNDNRKNDTDFYYWLNILALRAGDQCPILTIFNAKDSAPRQIVPDETLFQHFPGLLREAVDVDFADKDLRRFNALKDRIEQHFAALPALGKPFPAFWVRVREALARREEEHISWAQFRDICRAEKIEDEAEMRTIAQTLHNLGVLLWFPEVFGLGDLLVLQPQWCIDAVYKALDTQTVKDNFGQFSEAELHHIWRDERYRSQCNRLLKLMQHFDLCYPVGGGVGSFIAPQLLDLQPNPDPNFSAAGGITHRFQYEFMPAGLLTRFIARMSRHIHAPHIWRTGVALRWADSTSAEVTENQFGKEITLRVAGPERKRRLSEMRQTLESIHSGFRGLKYSEKVACNCPDCVNNAQPSLFILGELEQDAKHGGDAICRNNNWKKIPAQSILDGIEYRDTPRIFISYAPDDRRYVDEFTTMLTPLRKNGDWKIWHEAYLLPGDRFNDVVLRQFSEANVIVLLLTAKFFDSDDKWDIEMSRAIERHRQGNGLVVGVVVSACMWEETPFRLVQMLPRDGITVDSVENRDGVWKEVVKEIKGAVMAHYKMEELTNSSNT